MMKSSDATLVERAGYLYRQLLLLQRLFQVSGESDDASWLGTSSEASDLALCTGIREVLDELTEQARVFTTLPFPLREWRPGDGADDERWRALTEFERREVLSLVSGYEALITWGEELLCDESELPKRTESDGSAVVVRSRKSPRKPIGPDYLQAERARVARFRQEMGFLERRRIAETA
jgi:hypothetical protein